MGRISVYDGGEYFQTFKEPRNRFQGIDSASLCSLAGRYDNPIPTRFLDLFKNTRPGFWTLPSPIQTAFSPTQSTYRGRVEIGGVYLPSGEYTKTLYVMVDIVKGAGVGLHPHTLTTGLIFPSWLNVRQQVPIATLCVLCGLQITFPKRQTELQVGRDQAACYTLQIRPSQYEI